MAERRKKNKRKIIICILAVIVLILVICVLIFSRKKENNEVIEKEEETPQISESVYELPDTTYNGMTVTDISLEYLTDQNKTLVSFMINNTTDETIEKENVTAYFLNDAGEVLTTTNSTVIVKLDAGEQCKANVVLEGNLSATKQISLQRNENSANENNTTVESKVSKNNIEENKVDKEEKDETNEIDENKLAENSTL